MNETITKPKTIPREEGRSLCDNCKNAYDMPGGEVFARRHFFTQRYCGARRDEVNIVTSGLAECKEFNMRTTS